MDRFCCAASSLSLASWTACWQSVTSWIAAAMAGLAFDQRIRAVHLDQLFRARAGHAVQAINVLRDDRAQLARFLQPHDRVMHCVRLRVAKCLVRLELVIPMLDSRPL